MNQEDFVLEMADKWGLTVEEKETAIKQAKISDLIWNVDFPPMLLQFFDCDSDKLLDEKIEVLTALNEGKTISEIPSFYDILELYPKDNETAKIHWD